MNYEEALKASKCNPKGVNEMLEGLDWKCPECKGVGYFSLSKERILACPRYTSVNCHKCNGKGKIHYSYQPQWNDFILFDGIIASYQGSQEKGSYLVLRPKDKYDIVVPRKDCTPILPWETIEEVLRKAGLKLKLRFTSQQEWFALITGDRCEVGGIGKKRQEAVIKAALTLRKEVK